MSNPRSGKLGIMVNEDDDDDDDDDYDDDDLDLLIHLFYLLKCWKVFPNVCSPQPDKRTKLYSLYINDVFYTTYIFILLLILMLFHFLTVSLLILISI